MQLKDMMTKEVKTIEPDVSARKAAEQMALLDIGVLPIVEGGKPVGMITDRDLAIRVLAKNLPGEKTPVRDVMSTDIVAVPAGHDVEATAALMQERQIRRIVVLDDEEKVAGILSLGDLAVAHEDARVPGKVLERVSEPAEPTRPGR